MNNLLRDSYPNEDYIIIDSEDTIDFRDCIKSRYVVFCFAPHLDREEVTSFSILWERNLFLTRICFALFDLEHISVLSSRNVSFTDRSCCCWLFWRVDSANTCESLACKELWRSRNLSWRVFEESS